MKKFIQYTLLILAIAFLYSTAYYSQQNGGKFSSVEIEKEEIQVVIKLKPKLKPVAVPTKSEFVNMVISCYHNVDTELKLPMEIVVAQAGLESGWGKSRFAMEGNNLFGVREYNLNKPHIKAKGALDARWGVKVYRDYCGSVEHFMKLLSTAGVYGKFQNELRYQNSIITDGKYNWKALVSAYANIYAEDLNYANKVVNTIKNLKI